MDSGVKAKLDAFFQKYPSKSFRKHEIVIQADREPDGIFYLTQGIVRTYAVTANGEELTINLFRPVSFFPMQWATNGTIGQHYFEAITPVKTFVAPKAHVVAFLQENPDVMLDLISRIYKGLDGLLTHMEYLMVGNAYVRLIVVLLIAAKRFGEARGTAIKVQIPMTHSDLSTQAGMSRETVTREMKILKEKGIASFEKNNVLIFDLKRLEAELYH